MVGKSTPRSPLAPPTLEPCDCDPSEPCDHTDHRSEFLPVLNLPAHAEQVRPAASSAQHERTIDLSDPSAIPTPLLREISQCMPPRPPQLLEAGGTYSANYSNAGNASLREAKAWMAQAQACAPATTAGLTSSSPPPTAATGAPPAFGAQPSSPTSAHLAIIGPRHAEEALSEAFLVPSGGGGALTARPMPSSASSSSSSSGGSSSGGSSSGYLPKAEAAMRSAERERGGPRAVGGVERVDAFGRSRRFFTMEEIATHNTPDDCWLVAHGKVYDVTAFLPRHPAGELAILRRGGTDSTIDFDFHSTRAQRIWNSYLLGYVDTKGGRAGDCVIS